MLPGLRAYTRLLLLPKHPSRTRHTNKNKRCHPKKQNNSAIKCLRDEEGSRFNAQPLLNQRYVLMRLLGKGGFSEVYQVCVCTCACVVRSSCARTPISVGAAPCSFLPLLGRTRNALTCPFSGP